MIWSLESYLVLFILFKRKKVTFDFFFLITITEELFDPFDVDLVKKRLTWKFPFGIFLLAGKNSGQKGSNRLCPGKAGSFSNIDFASCVNFAFLSLPISQYQGKNNTRVFDADIYIFLESSVENPNKFFWKLESKDLCIFRMRLYIF